MNSSKIAEIKNILSPTSFSIIEKGKISEMRPVCHISMLANLPEEVFMNIISHKDVVVYNSLVYVKSPSVPLTSLINESVMKYKNSKDILMKTNLFNIYDQLNESDMFDLALNGIIITLVPDQHEHLVPAAIKYFPKYRVTFENKIYEFPSLFIYVPFSGNYVENPEVIGTNAISDLGGFDSNKGRRYQHPFVYTGITKIGQKVCLGSFYNHDEGEIRRRRLSQQIIGYIIQTEQILVSGYNRGVAPANGHLYEARYNKYIIRRL